MSSDVAISGMGKVYGGVYHRVSISGMGKVMGSIEAATLEISGSSVVEGDATIDSISISGRTIAKGNVKAQKMVSNGSMTVKGELRTDTLQSSGKLRCDGLLKAVSCTSSGFLSCGSDVEADEFHVEGYVQVNGLLNAGQVNIVFDGPVTISEIGADSVHIRKQVKDHTGINTIIMKLTSVFRKTQCSFRSIEANSVDIENTRVGKISGETIIIGPNSRVERIEYSKRLSIHPSSVVLKKVKM
ncbi:polymer-forming cytoskeletal protein [Paenibacillus alkalitolerans]|uniref:polymer-forming cytoskeletal protein n=1 Tax=Paenibacillus alkalitolerans TaxID=2799335 RepID=UPI0018F5AF08|nr:polymer-forming cytoskeletal protein [Paenibacillus alkalitolerans]